MKPRIGKKVYVIYEDDIYQETVFMLGKESFLCECVLDSALRDSYRTRQYYFCSHGRTWFTTLSAAKKQLIATLEMRRPNFTVKIKQMGYGIWSAFGERKAADDGLSEQKTPKAEH